ncbi:MAG: orotate phosphoribosyltransferase, partial [Promethearchaeota archaeon]
KGLIVSVDRMEKGKTDKGALSELHEEFDMKTCAIVTLDEIISYLHNKSIDGQVLIDDDMKNRIEEYRALYGSKSD